MEEVSETQCMDIKRYLIKELTILDDVINKSNVRQKAENSRFQLQVAQVKQISNELDKSRMEALERLLKVQGNLGIVTDPNEAFLQPLSDKVALGLMDRLGTELHEAEQSQRGLAQSTSKF